MRTPGLSERIARIIKEQGLKNYEFAGTLRISANYVSLLINGRKTNISAPLAKLLETTYGYRAEWVLTGEEPVRVPSEAERIREATVGRLQQMDAGEIKAVAAYIKMLETHEAVPSITDPADADSSENLTFAQRLETLTPGERRVYDAYCSGYDAVQAAGIGD